MANDWDIGLGQIGSNVAKIASGFGMKILAVDKKPEIKIIKKYKIKMVGLETLLKESEVVTLHVPAPRNLSFNQSGNIKLMKKGSILVNTSRGRLLKAVR
jgi:phosphoglycerate dehydrogenase-like enzyme